MNSSKNLSLADPGLLKTQAYINGQWCDANDGTHFNVTNPANGEVLATVPDMGADADLEEIFLRATGEDDSL